MTKSESEEKVTTENKAVRQLTEYLEQEANKGALRLRRYFDFEHRITIAIRENIDESIEF